ncbi:MULTISPECIES: hypothetical protein [unclassified Isoptericola]|uniref:hypothetical protein n=1 Tax=unclassified Isoptericola TaxID=2623355 RepID=UPI00365A196F
MLQRILGGVLVLIGLAAAALGVASATVWRDTDTVAATAKPSGDGTFVVTDPGVLGLVGDDVTISASVPEGQKVTLAVGRDVDVAGWVGNDPYSRVTGLSDWENLSVAAGEPADADAKTAKAPTTGPDPAGSDMWVAEASDADSVTLRWSDRPGRWTLLAAGVGKGAQAPTLELTWPRAVATPYLWPGVIAGAVLVLVGALLLVLGGRRVRAQRADRDQRDEVGPADATSVDADGAGPFGGPSAGPFAPVTPGALGAGPPSQSSSPSSEPEASAAGDPQDGTQDAGETEDGTATATAGTAEVPVAGRLLRRSRRRQRDDAAPATDETAPETDAAAPAAPAAPSFGDAHPVPVPAAAPTPHAPVPAAPASHEPVPEEPTTATGALRMTRRELRAQEEARRAQEQGGMTRMLRAITGSIPAVRPQQAAPAEAEAEPRPDLSTPTGRAAAWRATWGFGAGQSADADPRPTDTDGENR